MLTHVLEQGLQRLSVRLSETAISRIEFLAEEAGLTESQIVRGLLGHTLCEHDERLMVEIGMFDWGTTGETNE